MSAVAEETITSSEAKTNLIEQLHQKREEEANNAVQEQETDEVHVRTNAEDGEQVGEGSEGEEETFDREEGQNFQFTLDQDSFDVPEDAVFKFKADGKPVEMTLKEMRDAAAGGVAVRNRMRSLAEERKKLLDPYKNFNNIADKDPLSALKKVFTAIKQVDPKADVNQFLRNLGKQAQNLAQMSPSERKAYNLEKELNETRENLTEKERIAIIQERKQELIEDFGLNEEQIYQYGQSLLSDPTLAEGIKSEEDLFDRIEILSDEIQRQQAVVTALHKFNPNLKKNDPLVFELSSVLEKNPDFDEADLEEIAEKILTGVKKTNAAKALSRRQRGNVVTSRTKRQSKDFTKLPPKESLKAQLLQKRKSQH